MTTDQKGAIAEAAIVKAAIRLGFGVLKPLIAPERYDVVFDLRPGFVRIQCKWAVLQHGAVVGALLLVPPKPRRHDPPDLRRPRD